MAAPNRMPERTSQGGKGVHCRAIIARRSTVAPSMTLSTRIVPRAAVIRMLLWRAMR
jgi:hypothetical protein